MKTLVISLAAILSTTATMPASARPPYLPAFKDLYYEKGPQGFKDAVDGVKCNVCHLGEKKANRNEYGVALSKILTKADFDRLKPVPANLVQFAKEAMQKIESEKNADGKSFGDLINAGELPGGR